MSGLLITALAVTLRVLANPVANVFQKHLTANGQHPLLVNFLTYLGLSILCLPFAPAIHWAALPADFWYYSVLGGIAGAMGNSFLVKALQKGDLSVLGPINAYKSVVGIIAGIFLLGELPNVWGLAGTALIIWGSYFVLETTDEKFSWALLKRKEIQYRIWALILTAIEAVFIKRIIIAANVNIAYLSWCWFGALFSFLLLPLYKIHLTAALNRIRVSQLKQYGFLVLCIGTMQLSTNYVFDHMPVGYGLALFQLSALVSVWLGYRFFKEKDLSKKLLGAGIMIAGSVLIILMQ